MKKMVENEGYYDLLVDLCEKIENQRVFIIASTKSNSWKLMCADNEYAYPYGYTYNLIRCGCAKAKRGDECTARLHPYNPMTDISNSLKRFVDMAVELGYYKRKTNDDLGGKSYDTVWI